MNDRILAEEWMASRRRSVQMVPVALVLFLALGAIIFLEGLYQGETGFLCGTLTGIFGYWGILEAMTIVRVDRLLEKATATPKGPNGSEPICPPTQAGNG